METTLATRGRRALLRVLAPIVAILAFATCSSGGLEARAGDKVSPVPAGFVSHSDPLGFSLQRRSFERA